MTVLPTAIRAAIFTQRDSYVLRGQSRIGIEKLTIQKEPMTLMSNILTRGLTALLLSILLLGSRAEARMQQFPSLPAQAGTDQTWTAVVDGGLWNQPTTWQTGSSTMGVPGPGDNVVIPSGITVNIRSLEPSAIQTSSTPPGNNFWPGIRYVKVEGTLRFGIHWNTQLVVETLFIGTDGKLVVGAGSHPVRPDLTCRITILPEVSDITGTPEPVPIDLDWDPLERTRGIVAFGAVELYGEPRNHVAVVEADIVPKPSNATKILDVQDSWNWNDSDEVVLAGTTFVRGATVDDPLTDERFQLSLVGSTGMAPADTLTKNHLRATNPATGKAFDLHLAHLERNIIIESGWEDYFATPLTISARGHFMAVDGKHQANPASYTVVKLNYVRFADFGRTDKTIPLDDVKFSAITSSTYAISAAPGYAGPGSTQPILNRRGRYAVHFHKNGYILPGPARKEVTGCVVSGTPGWGFVNHSSYVNFHDCVAYDFAGSGFVTESGDELGTFNGCVAIHGTGLVHLDLNPPNKEVPPTDYIFVRGVFGDWVTRQVGDPRHRPQPLGDFAFGGEGFWFQGPLVTANKNIANSCSGAGMFWMTMGAVNNYAPIASGYKERYTGFPKADLVHVYPPSVMSQITNMQQTAQSGAIIHQGPRVWGWPEPGSNPDELVVLSDLPILGVSGFQCYASLVGVHLRFTNVRAESFFNEQPFRYHLEAPPHTYQPQNRPSQTLSELQLWNNEQGFRARYTESTNWKNVSVANEIGAYSNLIGRVGAEVNHQVRKHVLESVFISGYAMALKVQDLDGNAPNNSDNTPELTFSPGSFATCSNYGIQSKMYGSGSIFQAHKGEWPAFADPCQFAHETMIDETSLSVTGSPGSYSLNWTAQPIPETGSSCTPVGTLYPGRYLIRYRRVSTMGIPSDRFLFAVHTTTVNPSSSKSMMIPGLLGGQAYEFQVYSDDEGTIHPAGTSVPSPLGFWSIPVTLTP